MQQPKLYTRSGTAWQFVNLVHFSATGVNMVLCYTATNNTTCNCKSKCGKSVDKKGSKSVQGKAPSQGGTTMTATVHVSMVT